MAFAKKIIAYAILSLGFTLGNAAAATEPPTNINVPQHLAIGECGLSFEGGKTVKVCRDDDGRYKILPSDDNDAVLISGAAVNEKSSTSLCHERTMPGDIVSSLLGSPSCYIAEGSNTTCFTSQDACEQDQKLKVTNDNYKLRAQQQMPTTEHKRLLGDYYRCLYRLFGQGQEGHGPFQQCIDKGITLCNGDGMVTSRNYSISPITDRVILNNRNCADMLDAYYNMARHNFVEEFESYTRSEDAGVPYQPFTLDIRKYIGH